MSKRCMWFMLMPCNFFVILQSPDFIENLVICPVKIVICNTVTQIWWLLYV